MESNFKPPPSGWVTFGTHSSIINCHYTGLLIFSKERGEDGLPLWEQHDNCKQIVSKEELLRQIEELRKDKEFMARLQERITQDGPLLFKMQQDKAALPASTLPYPEIWGEVAAERERAHRKHGPTSMEQQPVDDLLRLAILAEEFGEVARVFNEARHRSTRLRHSDLLDLRAELIQVAAMAGGWAAAITNLTAQQGDKQRGR